MDILFSNQCFLLTTCASLLQKPVAECMWQFASLENAIVRTNAVINNIVTRRLVMYQGLYSTIRQQLQRLQQMIVRGVSSAAQ